MRTKNQSRAIGKIEYLKLKEACTNKKLLRAMALLYYGGFRVNEILQFKKSDVESFLKEQNEKEAFISKQNIFREFYVSKNAKQELSLLLHFCKSEYFVKYKGDSLRVSLNKFIKETLGDGFTSHGFRRGFISKIIRESKNPKLAQEVVGHKDFRTTLRYDEVSQEEKRDAYELID